MFVNTRLFSPVVFDGITQAPPDSYEWHEWWDEEYRRCTQGYEVGGQQITGRHYHYLNYTRILRQKDDGIGAKRLLPPKFLDVDHLFYWEFEKCKETGKDLLVLKRRQIGFSYKNAQIIAYDFSFIPQSQSLVTSGEAMYSERTMQMVLSALDYAADPNRPSEFYKNRQPNTPDHIQAMFMSTDLTGRKFKDGLLSEVRRRTTPPENPQAGAGLTLSMVLYEEGGKFKGIKDAFSYNKAAMEEAGSKTGIGVIICTGGEANTSIDEITDMMYDPATWGLMEYDNVWDQEPGIDDAPQNPGKVGLFIPATYFTSKEIVDADGNSHPELARPIILERREKVKKDKKAWLKEVTQYPLTIQEALLIPSGNIFNAAKLQLQKTAILRDVKLRDMLRRGEIDWLEDGQGNTIGAEWRDAVDGRFRMIEPPVLDETGKVPMGLYIAGTDSYDRDAAADPTRASFGACRMHKQFNKIDDTDDMPVCGLIERPETSDEFYEDTAKMCVLYGYGMNLVEYSNLGIFNWYRSNGFGGLLRQRPMIAYAAMSKSNVQNRDGIDPATRHIWQQFTADYIETSCHKIFDLQLIDKLIKYDPEKNDDEVDAFMLSILHAKDNASLPKHQAAEEKPFRLPRYSRKDGRMVRLWGPEEGPWNN
jgi:hypothetical protein